MDGDSLKGDAHPLPKKKKIYISSVGKRRWRR